MVPVACQARCQDLSRFVLIMLPSVCRCEEESQPGLQPGWCHSRPSEDVYKQSVVCRASEGRDTSVIHLRRIIQPIPLLRQPPTYNTSLIMRFSTIFSLTAVLAVLDFTTATPSPTRIQQNGNGDTIVARNNSKERSAPSARLHQTNWKEIQARKEMRMNPLYRRQQASALPYPTCPLDYLPVDVARYPNVDIVGADVRYQPSHLILTMDLFFCFRM